MASSLTFIVPGLLDPVPYLEQVPTRELPELPVFSKILSRGNLQNTGLDSDNPYLLYSITTAKLTDSKAENLSLASVLYHAETRKIDLPLENKWLMRVDPCCLVPDRDQLLLKGIYNTGLDQTEADQLVAEINRFYQDIDDDYQWQLYALAPEHWYLVCEQSIDINTVPPEKALYKPVKKYLPGGQDSTYWLNLLNEFQMIMHQSQVNQVRVQQGKPALNSVWFWANGLFQSEFKKLDNKALFSNLDFVKGLASCYSADYSLLPGSLKHLDFKQQSSIFVIRDFMDAIEHRELFQWLELIQRFEVEYLQEITRLLRNGAIKQCEFISPGGRRLVITKKLLSRWWRRNRSYQDFLINRETSG